LGGKYHKISKPQNWERKQKIKKKLKKNSDGFEDVLGMHNAHVIYIKNNNNKLYLKNH
jgi:hypothetical protein